MGIEGLIHTLNLTLEVFFLDLLLSGDNAVMIALACRSLPPRQTRQAMVLGTGAAIVLRILLTLLAGVILRIPALKLLGGVALAVIAIQLTVGDADADRAERAPARPDESRPASLGSIVATIVIADLVMSIDNVLALAAVANGNWAVLVLGLLLSVPLLLFGSWYVKSLLERYPVLTWLAGAMLGWFAGDIAVSDPLYADWVALQSPALRLVVPLAVAVYVVLQSRIIEGSRAAAQAIRPVFRQPPVREAARHAPQALAFQAMEAIAAPVAPARQEARRAAERVPGKARPPTRWLLAGAGGIAVIGVAYAVMHARMPEPDPLTRFDCPAKDISLYYKAGGQKIRLTSGSAEVQGIVKPNNRIDWGDYQATGTTLGFFPPTKVLASNATFLRVEGDMFDDVTCHVR